METHSLVNAAALALSQPRLTVHRLDEAAMHLVQETDVRTLPSDPPSLLKSGWVIETADLAKPLYDNVVCLGGYSIGEDAWVVGTRFPDGMFVGHWKPRWGDSDVESSFYDDYSPLVDSDLEHRMLTIDGIKLALTLGALLDAENTPMQEQAERQVASVPKRKPAPRNPNPYAWSVRRISLKPAPAPAVGSEPVGDEEKGEARDRSALHPETRRIRGFLRRQPHGPGRMERKWIYVSAFEATRYVGEKPLRVQVTDKRED